MKASKKHDYQYTRSLIEAGLDPLITINFEGIITDINQATVEATGVLRKNLIGTEFSKYFTEPEKAGEVYKEIFEKGSVKDLTLCLRNHNGKLKDILFNGSVYKDERGKVMGVVIVARDVTEQNRIGKELLEAKIFAELATSIAEEAKLKAEDAVRSKQQFLSNMSHEIRTPMNAILGFTKVILKTELTTKQREYLSAIKISGDTLIVLINDVLDLAKVDAGKMEFAQSPFKLASSLGVVLHLFETKIQEKNLELIKEFDDQIPEVLLGDAVRLHQMLINLVSNAVKFTSKGKITISVRLLKEDKKSVSIQFSLTDTGIGIKKDNQKLIFENFQQASNSTSKVYGGTGLGLAIVKQLVEAQGGVIIVESKLKVGTTFSFTLDFMKTNQKAKPEIEYSKLDETNKSFKVLVAEDIPLNQLLMRTLLDDFGFECDIAANGKIAIDKLQNKNYDIILMDLQMPEMNGFEATVYIRNVMNLKIPILALTADVTTADLEKCKAVGMNDYLAKPVDERILYSKIVGLISTLEQDKEIISKVEKIKFTNLNYLDQRSKSNPDLMMEMISLYLEQTPVLIELMKNSLEKKDWITLGAAVHKMIPSFSIVGIHVDFENIAKRIQEYANKQQQEDEIGEMLIQLENVCLQVYEELSEDLDMIRKTKLEKNEK